jgi:hypothetical protein
LKRWAWYSNYRKYFENKAVNKRISKEERPMKKSTRILTALIFALMLTTPIYADNGAAQGNEYLSLVNFETPECGNGCCVAGYYLPCPVEAPDLYHELVVTFDCCFTMPSRFLLLKAAPGFSRLLENPYLLHTCQQPGENESLDGNGNGNDRDESGRPEDTGARSGCIHGGTAGPCAGMHSAPSGCNALCLRRWSCGQPDPCAAAFIEVVCGAFHQYVRQSPRQEYTPPANPVHPAMFRFAAEVTDYICSQCSAQYTTRLAANPPPPRFGAAVIRRPSFTTQAA